MWKAMGMLGLQEGQQDSQGCGGDDKVFQGQVTKVLVFLC